MSDFSAHMLSMYGHNAHVHDLELVETMKMPSNDQANSVIPQTRFPRAWKYTFSFAENARWNAPVETRIWKRGLMTLGSNHFIIWGGLEELFSADYFFTWCLKLDFFFTHQLKPDFFFTKNWKSDYFFIVMFQVKDIHIIFRVEARLFFFAAYQSKKIFSTYRLGQIIFFGQKQRQIIFSKTLPAPPPDNEMVAPLCLMLLHYLPYISWGVSILLVSVTWHFGQPKGQGLNKTVRLDSLSPTNLIQLYMITSIRPIKGAVGHLSSADQLSWFKIEDLPVKPQGH